MRVVTAIGQPAVYYLISVPVAVLAWRQQKHALSYAIVFAVIAQVGNAALKVYFHRPRPDTLYVDNMFIKSYSFPSGHAFGAAVFLGLLAYLSLKYVHAPWQWIVPTGCSLLILLIGVSRVYLGAHFPSDVVAGWVMGFISLAVILGIFRP